jgi:DNA polymerase-3 subunit gamma/tau
MVQTLGNAIKRDRLAHAFLLTGVRGVGKTSTARLIAKALNCIGPDGQGGPTIDPCGVCEPCRAIAEGRHIDVIEMDAAAIPASTISARSSRRALFGGLGALQGLHHRRSPHAVQERVQRAAEDAGGAAAACEVPVRHDRGEQGAGDGAVALPALRPAAHSGRELAAHFAIASARRGCRGRARGARADRARGGGVGARRPVDPRSGDRACRYGRRRASLPTKSAICSALSDRGAIRRCSGMLLSGDAPARWPRCANSMIWASIRSGVLRTCWKPSTA